MISRVLATALPTLLFAFALGAGASCNGGTVGYPAISGIGGATTTASTSTGSHAGTGAMGTGGTESDACEGGHPCIADKDCPEQPTLCLLNMCYSGCCGTIDADAGATCLDHGGSHCDGNGMCVACVSASECPTSSTVCATPTCTSAHVCDTTNAMKGSPCSDGGDMVCDGKGLCLPASCADDVIDGDETDVDCGGDTCPACVDGKTCKVGTDCVDKACSGTPLTCHAPTCSDGAQNGNETDSDCGGAGFMGAAPCPRCVDGEKCSISGDCQSLSCIGGKCAPATCSDNVQNGNETDVDCGGSSCMPCADGKKCGNNASNCQNHICTNGRCQVPTCTDNVQNGLETDIDCGGAGYMGAAPCPPCNPGEKCGTGNDCVGGNCQGTCQCPTGMLVVPIQGGGIYCIDSIEVTYSAYNVFYSANPSTATQDAVCAWNLGWTPKGWPGTADLPVSGANWCQAAGYCKYQGRRLCGKIGGGSIAQTSFDDFATDQWFNACSAQGANCTGGGCYPYGVTYNPVQCNGVDSVDGGSLGPASYTNLLACQGGEISLLDMSGNVAEWEDSCAATSGENDACAVRGGSYLDGASGLRCDSGQTSLPITQPRDYAGPDVGFRCCL